MQSPPPAAGRPRGRPSPARRWAPVGFVLVTAAVAGVLWLSRSLHPGAVATDLALFLHLASLVFGFGAVLAVDWVALLWVAGRRRLGDVLRAADNVHIPIWFGYAGLLVTGALLRPDLTSGLTWAKMLLVLAVGWNGVAAMVLHTRLAAAGGSPPTRPLLVWSAASAAISQVAWWGATVIGFLNAT